MGYTSRYNINTDNPSLKDITCLVIIIMIIFGYLMNFQNLWEYFSPNFSFNDSFSVIMDKVPFKWFVCLVGVFVWPIGVITGWVW